jgi:hypothetical protein
METNKSKTVKHPLDLEVSILAKIRREFERLEKLSETNVLGDKGLKIEVMKLQNKLIFSMLPIYVTTKDLANMLIKLIKVDASEVYKYLAKFQNEYYKTVS